MSLFVVLFYTGYLINSALVLKEGKSNINKETINYSQLNNKDLGAILRFDFKLNIDLKYLVANDAIMAIAHMFDDYPEYISNIFSHVSKMISTNNIELSVKEGEYLLFKDSLNGNDKLNLDHYSKYVTSKNDKHDLFVVFDNLHVLGRKTHYNLGSICKGKTILIVDIGDTKERHPIMMASKIILGIGGILGFKKIEKNQNCDCGFGPNKFCVMQDQLITNDSKLLQLFDSCNIKNMKRSLQDLPCLAEKLPTKRLFGKCGDGVVDVDEQCDCGDQRICTLLTNKNQCCTPSCKFSKPQHQCSIGDCCENCMYTKNICRKSIGECDKPEYCSGKSSTCPIHDVVLPNHQLCRKKTGFCFDGNCMNFDNMCKYAYNDSRVIFKTSCVTLVNHILTNKCKHPIIDPGELHKHFCKDKEICSYFVCGVSEKIDVKNAYYFSDGLDHCIVPREKNIGILQKAPNFMQCDQINTVFTKYCYNKKCVEPETFLQNSGAKLKSMFEFVKMEIFYKNFIVFFSDRDEIVFEGIRKAAPLRRNIEELNSLSDYNWIFATITAVTLVSLCSIVLLTIYRAIK